MTRVLEGGHMSRQDGSALFVCLMILIILSLLGISALRMTLGQSLIAMNSHAEKLSFEGAEMGLSQVIARAEDPAELSSREILPDDFGETITVANVQDSRGVVVASVAVTKVDISSRQDLAAMNLLMMARTQGMGFDVVSESFQFTSTGQVDAVGAQSVNVQETLYTYLK